MSEAISNLRAWLDRDGDYYPDDFDLTQLLPDDLKRLRIGDIRGAITRDDRRSTLLRALLEDLRSRPMADTPAQDSRENDLATHIAAELGEEVASMPSPLMPARHLGSLVPAKWVLVGHPDWHRPRVLMRLAGTATGWMEHSGSRLDFDDDGRVVWWELPEFPEWAKPGDEG